MGGKGLSSAKREILGEPELHLTLPQQQDKRVKCHGEVRNPGTEEDGAGGASCIKGSLGLKEQHALAASLKTTKQNNQPTKQKQQNQTNPEMIINKFVSIKRRKVIFTF